MNYTPPGLVTDNGDVIYYKLRGDGKRMVKLQDPVPFTPSSASHTSPSAWHLPACP